MNFSDSHIVSVHILGKNYTIKCPPEQASALEESAQIIEAKLREMRQAANSTSTDRMLVVIALNLCHELLTLKKEKSTDLILVDYKLHELQQRIQHALSLSTEEALTI